MQPIDILNSDFINFDFLREPQDSFSEYFPKALIQGERDHSGV